MVKVLFVCMGNICRSPTAQGVFSKVLREQGLEDRVSVDSAGTHAYHIGKAPDDRALEAAARRDIDLSVQRARQVEIGDFTRHDYILAMDRDNLDILRALCPSDLGGRIGLFMDFAPEWKEREVPDPYWGGQRGFERVLDMVEAASRGLLGHIQAHHLRAHGGDAARLPRQAEKHDGGTTTPVSARKLG